MAVSFFLFSFTKNILMKIDEILSLPQDQWLDELKVDPVTDRDIDNWIEYFDGKHPILTDPSRQDYYIPKWKYDDETGEPVLDSTGKRIAASPEQVKRTRLILDYQVQIVDTAVGMCVGAPVTLTLNSADQPGHADAFEIFVDQWRNKSRFDSFNMKLARALFKESKAAEILFIDPDDTEQDIKVKLLSKENGDDFWAHFDDDGKLDALTRIYTKRALVDGKAEDLEVTQIWTAAKRYESIDGGSTWEEFQNPYEKNTLVYYDQKKPEWLIVKDLITKQELVRSRNSDVNKRVGNPNVVIDGEVANMPDVEQDVKVWTLKNGQDFEGKPIKSNVSYLQLETAHEAIDKEIEQDKQDMYKLTWPDLSFLRDSIKTGTLSGTAIKLMFTDAFVKIANKKEIFEDFSRRVAVMKRMLAVTRGSVFEELNISVEFNSILPENLQEITDIWTTAKQGGITSTSKAVSNWPLNDNDPDVLDQIKADEGLEAGVA